MKHQFVMPSSIDHLRNTIIDKLMAISNKDYLIALNNLIENSSVENDIAELSAEQILMLKMSDNDIKNGDVIDQQDLDKEDLKWLKVL
ncbi:hypothetical protein D3C87_318420 [compost metagenome]|uniref:hypothetical protein n=1 Tax=Pedobacter sp. ok626 TaxID=1761882 RepID=UPI000FA1F50A|nr:hypothetical protein [Pedobacter sp. ok626]